MDISGARAQEPKANPRGFLGWRMVALGFLAANLAIGLSFGTFGVLIKPVAEEFGASRGMASFGIAIVLLLMGIAGPALGVAFRHFRIRSVMIAGALLMAAGFAVASRANVFLRITPARARGPSAADDDNHLPADDGEAAAAAAAGAAAAASAATAHGEQDGSEPGGPLLDTAAPPEPLLLDGGDQADGAAADQTAEAPAADTPATAATETTAGTLLDAVDVSVELLQLVEDGARGEEEAAAGGQDAAEK